ncbi:hypothetical protein Gorai_017322, partial [Gossypium raimondii]|nr:hypothetical protein [Gossypium raimondii]
MVASPISASFNLSLCTQTRPTSISSLSPRYMFLFLDILNCLRYLLCTYKLCTFVSGLSSRTAGLPMKINKKGLLESNPRFLYLFAFFFMYSYDAIQAKTGNPPVMPAVMTPGGPLDLSTVLFRNRIIFIGQPVNSQVAQRVI